METTSDGFKISQEDLAIRGPGEFFGTRQSGLPEMRAGNIISDLNLLEQARREAQTLVSRDPSLKLPEHRDLMAKVKRIFGRKLELLSV